MRQSGTRYATHPPSVRVFPSDAAADAEDVPRLDLVEKRHGLARVHYEQHLPPSLSSLTLMLMLMLMLGSVDRSSHYASSTAVIQPYSEAERQARQAAPRQNLPVDRKRAPKTNNGLFFRRHTEAKKPFMLKLEGTHAPCDTAS